MSGLTAWSYSRLNSYETCPKKYHAISVAKTVKEQESEHTTWGTDVHNAFAAYFKTGKPLPLAMKQYEKYLAMIKQAPGEFIVEQKLAINASYEPTGWFDNDVYCRIISDLTIINGDRMVLWDWKTGKPSSDFSQLKISAAVMFQLMPETQLITMAYFWAKNKTITRQNVTRSKALDTWNELIPRIQRYHDAHVNKEFPPKPSYLCKYCPVSSCPNWERR